MIFFLFLLLNSFKKVSMILLQQHDLKTDQTETESESCFIPYFILILIRKLWTKQKVLGASSYFRKDRMSGLDFSHLHDKKFYILFIFIHYQDNRWQFVTYFDRKKVCLLFLVCRCEVLLQDSKEIVPPLVIPFNLIRT
jgi:hypothetical protein